jgi:hypothetical protein
MNEQNPISAPAAKPAAPRFAKLIGLFVLILLPLYFFGSLAEDVINKEGLFFDKPILLFLHQHATANWDAAMIFFTTTGSARVIVPFNVLVLLLLVFKKQWAKSWFWIFTVGGAALMNLLAKHALQSMAVACGVVALLWETRWRNLAVFIAIPFVVAVGTSRAYLGVHYPSDILAGWLASFAWVIGLSAAFAHLQRKHGVAPSPTHQAPHPALFDDTSAPTVVERRR